MSKNPETKFKEKVQRDLKTLKKIWFYKTQEVSLRGILDLQLCLNGMFVAIELKASEKARVMKLQEYNAERIRKAGGLAFIVWPEIWPQVFEQLRMIDESV